MQIYRSQHEDQQGLLTCAKQQNKKENIE